MKLAARVAKIERELAELREFVSDVRGIVRVAKILAKAIAAAAAGGSLVALFHGL